MHLHKYEKIWLLFGVACLVIFLTVVGVGAFAFGEELPSGRETIDPQTVDVTPPFNQPGLKKVGENKYEAVIVAFAFGFQPNKIEVPAGAEVRFILTSKDVVHGFAIPATNINMMITPGYINTAAQTFNKPGTYLVVCNEYCGVGHQAMSMQIEVK